MDDRALESYQFRLPLMFFMTGLVAVALTGVRVSVAAENSVALAQFVETVFSLVWIVPPTVAGHGRAKAGQTQEGAEVCPRRAGRIATGLPCVGNPAIGGRRAAASVYLRISEFVSTAGLPTRRSSASRRKRRSSSFDGACFSIEAAAQLTRFGRGIVRQFNVARLATRIEGGFAFDDRHGLLF